MAYSLALDQGLEPLAGEGNIITESSLSALRKMAQDKINDLKRESHDGFHIFLKC